MIRAGKERLAVHTPKRFSVLGFLAIIATVGIVEVILSPSQPVDSSIVLRDESPKLNGKRGLEQDDQQPLLTKDGRTAEEPCDVASHVTMPQGPNTQTTTDAALPPINLRLNRFLTVENALLRLDFDTCSASFSVLDKRTGQWWLQAKEDRQEVLVKDPSYLAPGARGITATLEVGEIRLKLELVLPEREDGDLLVTLTPVVDGDMRRLSYPFPFIADDVRMHLVIPQDAGFIVGVTDFSVPAVLGTYQMYRWAGVSMPWFGVTDSEQGFVCIVETDVDVELEVRKTGEYGRDVMVAQWRWLATMGRVGYPRTVRYHFFESGGYVAAAKRYRRFLMDQAQFVSLREKANANPRVDELVGGVRITAPEETQEEFISQARWLKDRGIQRMLVAELTDPRLSEALADMGFLAGSYIDFKVYWPPDDGSVLEKYGGVEHATCGEDGQAVVGWTDPKTGKQSRRRCSIFQLPLAKMQIPAAVAERKLTSIYVDAIGVNGFHECWHPKHRHDRREDREQKLRILALAGEEGLVAGTEIGHAWVVPSIHVARGIETPTRFTLAKYGKRDPYVIPDPLFLRVNLGEQYRVPLYQLVFHDAVVSTWRPQFAANKYVDQSLWHRQDLFQILYGVMPCYWLVKEQPFEMIRERLVDSAKRICESNRKIGYEEMLTHRFVTEDRTVQETIFASGRRILVNLGRHPFRDTSGSEVKPMGYLALEGGGK